MKIKKICCFDLQTGQKLNFCVWDIFGLLKHLRTEVVHCVRLLFFQVWHSVIPPFRYSGQVGHLGYLPSSLLIGQYGRFLTLGHMGRDKYHPD